MDKIAFVIGHTTLYWSTILVAFAAAVGVFLFLAFYLWDEEDLLGAFCAVPMSIALGLVLSRLAHWYFRADSYRNLAAAFTDLSVGGLALMGAFFGCLLIALLLALLRKGRHLGAMLDSMSIAGAGAVSLGRLACLCNTADRGQVVKTASFWASPLINTETGAVEYRLATFRIQAMVTGLIFLGLVFLYFWGRREKRRRAGDLFWLFALYYGACQAVLDSTRYDSLYFRSNGFVSVVQILCIIAVVVPILVFAVRYKKANGWAPGCLAVCVSCGVLLGLAGWMEYYVQRHGNQAVFAYSVMSGSLLGIMILGTILWALARRREIPREKPTIYPNII